MNEKIIGMVIAAVLLMIQTATGIHLQGVSDSIMHKDVLTERHKERDQWRIDVDRRLDIVELKMGVPHTHTNDSEAQLQIFDGE